MNKVLSIIAVLVLGGVLGAGGYAWFGAGPASDGDAQNEGKGEPLYWVAPMDANYKRDKPGKSPMGMDLVPVYEEGGGPEASPGTVKISPDVINNLGVRTGKAEKGRFRSEINTVGYVQYDEDQAVHIHSRVEGWSERLMVKAEGDPVTRGEPLYEIYSPTLVNAQEEFLLALKRGNDNMVQASARRLRALNVPEETIETIRNKRKVFQTITINAPQSGVIDNLNVREGFFIQPSRTVMSIGVLNEVWAVGEVFQSDAARIEVGDPVTMTSNYLPGKSWEGHVDYIYPSLDETTNTLRFRTRIDNPGQRLKVNMFAQLAIHQKSAEQTLLIPREALIRTGHQNRAVLALGEGRFKSVEVEVGRVGTHKAEILEGLKAGDRIATSAQFLLDSESSKTSDFQRMHHGEKATPGQGKGDGDGAMKSMDHSSQGD